MKTRNTLITLLLIVQVIALIAALAGCEQEPTPTVSPIVTPGPDPVVALGMTHFTGLMLQGSETDEFVVDQQSTGDIAEFRDNGSSVFRIADGGAVTIAGDVGVTGDLAVTGDVTYTGDETHTGDVTVQGTVTVDGQADAVQLTVQAYTTPTANAGQVFVVEQSTGTDVFSVDYNGATIVTSTLQVNSTTDLQGTIADSGGTLTIGDDVLIDGAADAVQLTVQAYATPTVYGGQVLVVEQSDGTDVFSVDYSGNTVVTGTFQVNSTSDFQDDIADSAGTLTIADNVLIDGAADLAQFTVQGHTTQTTNSELVVVEQSDGTNVFEVDNSGNTIITGTTTAVGNATFSAVVAVGTWLNLTPGTSITLTGDATITPNGTYQPLTSASAVTCSTTTCVADGTRDGDLLIILNDNASDEITIDGTGGNVECKANVVLGAGDTLTLIWNDGDSNWYCLSTYDNS